MRAKYKAKTLSGAERRVRNLEKQLAETSSLLDKYAKMSKHLAAHRYLLAKLSSTTPQFDNPLVAMEAQTVRDAVLTSPQWMTNPNGY